jgi:hypothetical protein
MMTFYLKTFLIAGVLLPVLLHMLARESTPWWPDTVSMGIAFGAAAVLIGHKARTDRAMNRRLWKALKDRLSWWIVSGRHF